MSAGNAWYEADREELIRTPEEHIVGALAEAATREGLHIEQEQNAEWHSSVGLLQRQLNDRVEAIRKALATPELAAFTDVVLEYDFRRRGLRIDCILLGKGIIAILEFKRSTLTGADRDQVTNYAVNLVEFHEETRRLCETENCIVVPILVLTGEKAKRPTQAPPTEFHGSPWSAIVRTPLESDSETLRATLIHALDARRSQTGIQRTRWLTSQFAPSSSILDAAISLYGQHEVSAISQHAAPIESIHHCTEQVAAKILESRRDRKNRIIFVSGAPGAGKTLVGLDLTFDQRFRSDAVFVTGNAPLVEVLSEALKGSYLGRSKARTSMIRSGYARQSAPLVAGMATFKIVKAHNFLGERGKSTHSSDGRVVIFDEAQRTYEKGREVVGKRLEENEAELILTSLEKSYPDGGAVVVALIGHNQAINRGELGITAWMEAAEKRSWHFAVDAQTLDVSGLPSSPWVTHRLREHLTHGHLPHSLRFYRNQAIENWVGAVLDGDSARARTLAESFPPSDTIWLARNLAAARAWARKHRTGEERAGIIASSNAKRLSAEGLFVDYKPEIAPWMLAPTGDVRSSNMLETVQKQYQVQGLELDYTLVCWDLDLRRIDGQWRSYKLNGSAWQKDSAFDVALNSHRVLLTRARKGMAIFVPLGDSSGEDTTRDPALYDSIAKFLIACGARPLEE